MLQAIKSDVITKRIHCHKYAEWLGSSPKTYSKSLSLFSSFLFVPIEFKNMNFESYACIY